MSSDLTNCFLFFFLMIRRPPRSTLSSSSAASDVYKRQEEMRWTPVLSALPALGSYAHLQQSPVPPRRKSRVVFLGTGNSSGTPMLSCVVAATRSCNVCEEALRHPRSKNRRNNPSLLLCYEREGGTKYIQIDAGKTFRDSILCWYREFGVPGLDALVLTHEHADAVFGIDEMRLVQRPRPMEVWASQQCLHALRGVYGYLMPGPSRAKSFTADLVWNKIPAQENTSTTTPEFQVHGLWIQPVPVVHGPGSVSYTHLRAHETPEHLVCRLLLEKKKKRKLKITYR
eukprot:TRINITY_DN3392_c0_g1_i11.p1 TRINITY_DN3392_c0_g1~~TRINITY_DN3392_c0_g1_i11.p1  ORF type:complete len:285 (+),score=59.49 TRINITY_DN3392_c0_g1_i11:86-940(+)